MAITRRSKSNSSGWSVDEIQSKLGNKYTAEQIQSALTEFGSVSNADELATFERILTPAPITTTVTPSDPGGDDRGSGRTAALTNPSEKLAAAQQRALDASIQAAATMGDATSGLFQQVEQKLSAMRQQRDEQLAEQIAARVFEAENNTLGKSFTGLLAYVETFDPYKGTALEGLTGSTAIDISKLMQG